jgi:3-oxoadipate enol-lactonase
MDWIDANGVALRYDLAGAGAHVLVLVHEMGGMLESWDEVAPPLARSRRVLRYDIRGAGLSEKARGRLTFDTMADDLHALLAALGVEGKVALAGCAVGAAIAIRFATRFPERASALVAMSPALGPGDPDRRAAMLARAEWVEREGMRAIEQPSLAASYPEALRGDARRYARFRARWLGNDPASFAAINRMLAEAQPDADLARVACPTLVVGGGHDGLRPPALVETIARAIPGAQYRLLDTGHFMAVQTPEPVAAAIEAFLTASGADRAGADSAPPHRHAPSGTPLGHSGTPARRGAAGYRPDGGYFPAAKTTRRAALRVGSASSSLEPRL